MKNPCLALFALCVFGSTYAEPAFAESSVSGGEVSLDQRIEAYIRRRQEKCPNATESFGWICGATVRMPGSHISHVCTSLDEPFFSGSLSLPSKPHFLGHTLVLQYQFPLRPLVECKDDPAWANPRKCATISLYPLPETVFGIFRETAPDPLPDDLPSRPFHSVGHTFEPDAYSSLDGTPVAFFYTRWIGDKPGQPQDQCQLRTRIGETDIGISLTLPCIQMRDWKTHLGTAILQVKERIVRKDYTASCDVLPDSAVILTEPWMIDDLRRWLELNR